MRTTARTLLPVSLMLTLFASPAAFAADKKEATLGNGKPAGKYMTRDELRSCLARKDKVAQMNADAAKERAALTDVKDGLARNGEELKQALETLDRTNAEAVNAYNEKTTARDKQIDEFQTRADAFNNRVVANKAEVDSYASSCENRRYFEEDEIAIKKGK
jgi:hypothetical protein